MQAETSSNDTDSSPLMNSVNLLPPSQSTLGEEGFYPQVNSSAPTVSDSHSFFSLVNDMGPELSGAMISQFYPSQMTTPTVLLYAVFLHATIPPVITALPNVSVTHLPAPIGPILWSLKWSPGPASRQFQSLDEERTLIAYSVTPRSLEDIQRGLFQSPSDGFQELGILVHLWESNQGVPQAQSTSLCLQVLSAYGCPSNRPMCVLYIYSMVCHSIPWFDLSFLTLLAPLVLLYVNRTTSPQHKDTTI